MAFVSVVGHPVQSFCLFALCCQDISVKYFNITDMSSVIELWGFLNMVDAFLSFLSFFYLFAFFFQ